MRLGRLAVLVLLGAVLPLKAKADDNTRWQGAWKLVACTYDGAPKMNDVTWTVIGDRYTVRLGQLEETWAFKLDPSAKRIDATRLGKRLTGIYELSGDLLRICYDLTGRHYPKAFDASAGSHQIVYEFRRS